ncbi:MAG: DUF3108 domain-containing protein [Rhizobiaceae bacterium]
MRIIQLDKICRVQVLFFGFLATIFVWTPLLHAEEIHHKTKFSVKFGGLTVGTASFDIKLNDEHYKMTGSGTTAGLVRLFSSGKGNFNSTGTIDENKVNAAAHSVFVREKKKNSTLKMAFADKSVTDVQMVPDKRKKHINSKQWIPIQAKHTQNVIDPASSLLMPIAYEDASDPRKVCGRNLEIFDGQSRYTMKLSYKTTRAVKTKGYKGFAHVCKLQYIPIAGYRKGRKNVEYMRKNQRMEFWLAPITGTNIFTPIRIEVATQYGKVTAIPQYFGLTATQ